VLGEYLLQAELIVLRILEKRWKSKEFYLKKSSQNKKDVAPAGTTSFWFLV
jgi:hypothetical protein